jgi:hypothetical protein
MDEKDLAYDTSEVVDPKSNELKEWLVGYVGSKLDPADGNVTVAMIVEVLADDFPEFVWAVAEENFFRGYKQALEDKMAFEKNTKKSKKNA